MGQIVLEHINKSYRDKKIFEDFNLDIDQGEFIGIKGESGAGKSTLLNIIGLLEECEGNVIIEGKCMDSRKRKEVQKLLRDKMGYLFQNFALIDDWSVYENLKIVLDRNEKKKSRPLILQELEKVGLVDALDKKIFQLSGGEQQRVAVVRLILHKCDVILADEPTGSLDQENARMIMNLLKELNKQGKTIIIVSHDKEVMDDCSRVISLA